MKSSVKHSIDFKRSLTKRAQSTNKFQPPLTLSRDTPQPFSSLNKSHTLRIMQIKQRKINNYFNDKQTVTPKLKTARELHKKHQTVKLQIKNIKEQLLLKKSDKMKLLYWNKDPILSCLPKIVVSADFIINQDNFWQSTVKNDQQKYAQTSRIGNNNPPKINPDAINPATVKEWKHLHKNNFVIWTIRRKSTLSKLQTFSNLHSLPLHSIFFIRKKKNYTVDYSAIQRIIQKQKLMKNMGESTQNTPINNSSMEKDQKHYGDDGWLSIFQTIKLNIRDLVSYQSYRSRVPVVMGLETRVALIRVDREIPGLQGIGKCLQRWRNTHTTLQQSSSCRTTLSKIKIQSAQTSRKKRVQIYQLPAINNYLHKYLNHLLKQQQQSKQSNSNKIDSDWQYDEQQISLKIEQMKKKLISQMIQDNGRYYQFDGGSSIYNFVGEMFKRNYKILFDNILQQMDIAHRKKRTPIKYGPMHEGDINNLDMRVEYFQFELR